LFKLGWKAVKMFEATKPSSVADSYVWITMAAFGAFAAPGAANASDVSTVAQRVLNLGNEISPWAVVSRTTPEDYLPTRQTILFNEWHFELSNRMARLALKQDGWKGPDSLAASPEALEYASRLLRKFAAESIDRRPTVGLDFEGTFSFAWSESGLRADLTVYDDGTYSFFASDGTNSATADDALVSDQLPAQLLALLLS